MAMLYNADMHYPMDIYKPYFLALLANLHHGNIRYML